MCKITYFSIFRRPAMLMVGQGGGGGALRPPSPELQWTAGPIVTRCNPRHARPAYRDSRQGELGTPHNLARRHMPLVWGCPRDNMPYGAVDPMPASGGRPATGSRVGLPRWALHTAAFCQQRWEPQVLAQRAGLAATPAMQLAQTDLTRLHRLHPPQEGDHQVLPGVGNLRPARTTVLKKPGRRRIVRWLRCFGN